MKKGPTDMDEQDPRIRQAYRQADHPEPPPALDARILAAARAAVERPRPGRAGWWRWALPVSTTAVLVLAMTLVLKVQREAPEQLSVDAAPALSKAPEAAPLPPARAPSEPPAVAAARAPEKRAAPRRNAEPAPMEQADMAPPAAQPVMPSPPPMAPGAATVAPQPFPQAAPAPAEAATAMARPRAETKMAAPRPSAGAEIPEPNRAPAMGSAAVARESLSTVERPEQALDRIRRLLREGREDEAHRALAEFIRRHPDYTLPEDLRKLRD